jgi:prepilin-type N-terminal cleavage/methylation domain-containing protein
MRRKGFTLIELLVVIAIIALLVTLLLPKLQQARQLAKKAACMANLNGIGKAVELYKESFHKGPPLINRAPGSDPETDIPVDSTTDLRPEEVGGVAAWDNFGANAMQNVWLLMKEDLVGEVAFLCPADSPSERTGPGTDQPGKFGWSDSDNFSYGMQSPYSENGNKNPWVDDMNGSVVIFADKNPGAPLSVDQKPTNHRSLGTAFLIASGSAGFHGERENSLCGKDGDDIYTIQDDAGNDLGTEGLPGNEDDTYICRPNDSVTP